MVEEYRVSIHPEGSVKETLYSLTSSYYVWNIYLASSIILYTRELGSLLKNFNNTSPISHLLVVDDFIFFVEINCNTIQNVNDWLNYFCSILGQKDSLDKPLIARGLNKPNLMHRNLALSASLAWRCFIFELDYLEVNMTFTWINPFLRNTMNQES